jgi:hypothetical protein
MSEAREIMEFLRDHVPTKTELTELRQHMDERFDELENKLDVRDRVHLLRATSGHARR